MAADVEICPFKEDSRKAGVILACSHMKHISPVIVPTVDNHIIFNFEFIAPIRGGPGEVIFCQGYIASYGEFYWKIDKVHQIYLDFSPMGQDSEK